MNIYHAINAGGSPRKVRIRLRNGLWVQHIPLFDDHDQCRKFWDHYAKANNEEGAWAISTHPPFGWTQTVEVLPDVGSILT